MFATKRKNIAQHTMLKVSETKLAFWAPFLTYLIFNNNNLNVKKYSSFGSLKFLELRQFNVKLKSN